jgi:hypothetical protein
MSRIKRVFEAEQEQKALQEPDEDLLAEEYEFLKAIEVDQIVREHAQIEAEMNAQFAESARLEIQAKE